MYMEILGIQINSISPFILIVFIFIVLIGTYFISKYGKYRKEAYATMNKLRIVAYCIPLIFSAFLVIMLYPMTDLFYYSMGFSEIVMLLASGFYSGIFMFDAVESRSASTH